MPKHSMSSENKVQEAETKGKEEAKEKEEDIRAGNKELEECIGEITVENKEIAENKEIDVISNHGNTIQQYRIYHMIKLIIHSILLNTHGQKHLQRHTALVTGVTIVILATTICKAPFFFLHKLKLKIIFTNNV